MANMSYCRFRNTLLALQDCRDAIESLEYDEDFEELSPEESAAKERLIELMAEILQDLGWEVSEDGDHDDDDY